MTILWWNDLNYFLSDYFAFAKLLSSLNQRCKQVIILDRSTHFLLSIFKSLYLAFIENIFLESFFLKPDQIWLLVLMFGVKLHVSLTKLLIDKHFIEVSNIIFIALLKNSYRTQESKRVWRKGDHSRFRGSISFRLTNFVLVCIHWWLLSMVNHDYLFGFLRIILIEELRLRQGTSQRSTGYATSNN